MMVTIYGLTLLLLVAPDVLAPKHGCAERAVTGGVSMAEVERIASLVDQHICTGVYRDPNLSLEALARAAAGELSRHTILELAFDAGFPSKSTFNRVFKDRFSQSPSEYLSQHENFLSRLGDMPAATAPFGCRRREAPPLRAGPTATAAGNRRRTNNQRSPGRHIQHHERGR